MATMIPDLRMTIGGLPLQNPVLVASGTFGYGREFADVFDLNRLGAIVTKTITKNPRIGNSPPRIVETPSGMLNAIGLQNVGMQRFVADKLPFLRGLEIPIIVSIMGHAFEELVDLVENLEMADGIDGYELNLSCPNVSYGGTMFAHEARLTDLAVSAVRRVTKRTVIAKLAPEVADISAIARAAEDAGADAVSLMNTITGMAIDIESRRPVLANVVGGLSGPCIRPIAVRLVYEAAQALSIPVIGIGGITCARDAIEFLIAGASAIQIGTVSFINPGAPDEILSELAEYLLQHRISRLEHLVGSIKPTRMI